MNMLETCKKSVADSAEKRKWQPRRIVRVTVRACGIGISREFVIDRDYHPDTEIAILEFARKVRKPGIEVVVEDFIRTDSPNCQGA